MNQTFEEVKKISVSVISLTLIGYLAPVYSKAKRSLTLLEIKIIHRYPAEESIQDPKLPVSQELLDSDISKAGKSEVSEAINTILGKNIRTDVLHSSTDQDNVESVRMQAQNEPFMMQVFSFIPYVGLFLFESIVLCLQLESFKSCGSACRAIVEQVAMRYISDGSARVAICIILLTISQRN
jgi:hypothetical protein